MARNSEFDYEIANAFLVGFHEERTEDDPDEPYEPEMTQNVIR